MVKPKGCRVEVTQRLKRFIMIYDKLQREATLDLSRMQDIGGVRAVLDSIDEAADLCHAEGSRPVPRLCRLFVSIG